MRLAQLVTAILRLKLLRLRLLIKGQWIKFLVWLDAKI